METPNGKDQKCKVMLHQLPQVAFAHDHDCDVIVISSIIFLYCPQFQIFSFFQEEVSM